MKLILLKIGLWIGIFDLIFCHVIPKEFLGNKNSIRNDSTQEICETFECIQTASQIMELMDETISPCDNFYQFACGNFLRQKIVPEDQIDVGSFSILNMKVEEQLKSLIAEKPDTNLTYLLKPNLFYESCMNTSSIEMLGSKPIQDIMNSMGGWPVILGENWNLNGTWKWEKLIQILFELGLDSNFILKFFFDFDYQGGLKQIIQIDAPNFGLNEEYLIKGFNNTKVQDYYQYMVNVAVELGVSNRETAENELKNSLNFEIQLAKISYLPPDIRRNFTAFTTKMTLKKLQRKYMYIDWLKYLNSLIPPNVIKIKNHKSIDVGNVKFFDNLENLLENTSHRVIANYIIWRTIDASVAYLSENFRNQKLKFSKIVTGLQKLPPRWKKCIQSTTTTFPIPIISLYNRKYFTSTKKQIVTEMILNIRDEFFNILSENDWMENRTLTIAKNKLNRITYLVGSPDEIKNDEIFEEYFQDLILNSDQFFDSARKIKIFNRNNKFDKLPKLINFKYLGILTVMLTVNAFYSQRFNLVVLPASILQDKFFDANRPKYMNFGAIGSIIGHEITHGFDDKGKQIDFNGNIFNWWENVTNEKYRIKADCIVNQYGNFTDTETGLKLNGIQNQGENIADNGGIKFSYLAYKKWVEKNGVEPKLPGLRYKPEQLFWISNAQISCSKYKKEYLEYQIAVLGHSPSQFRTIGAMQNRKEFSKDFECPLGSPMNPAKKCSVW